MTISLNISAILLMQPKLLLAFFAAMEHSWLMFVLVSTRTPRLFSRELFSR